MNILVDVDDVCADLVSRWLSLYNEDFNDNLTKADIQSWNIAEYVKPEAAESIYEYLERDDLYDDVHPITGALLGIERLRNMGHRIIFVTTATKGHAGKKLEWLQKHGFLSPNKINDIDYVECADKTLINGDLIIDDRFTTVEKFGDRGILFTQTWNKHKKWIIRADTWSDIIFWVKQKTGDDNKEVERGAAKFDDNKEAYDLIPTYPLSELAKLYTRGKQKYAVRNWETGFRWGRVFAAMMRHAWLFWGGEDNDPETGVHHMVSVAWNAFALVEFSKTHPELDDRPYRRNNDNSSSDKQ